MEAIKTKEIIDTLNRIMELELSGVVKYTHYALMVFGFNRIPIVSWLKENATESLTHANKAGEFVTLLGGHPSLKIAPLLDSQHHSIKDILTESFEHEKAALVSYYDLLKIVKDNSISLEDYARNMISTEELHLDSVTKMLRKSDDTATFKE